MYGPKRRDDSARSTSGTPSAISVRFHKRTILIVEQHQLARPASRAARRDSCSSISASSPSASGSGRSSTSSRPSRIASPDRSQRVSDAARRGRVAFVEDEIDDVKNGVEPVRQLLARRHLIRNARVADLRLRPDDALGDGGRIGEKRARDLLGGERRRPREASAPPARPASAPDGSR